MSTIALNEITTSESSTQFEPIARWYRERPTQVAFVVSLLLHALLIALIPGFRSVPLDTPAELTVQIVTEEITAAEIPAVEPVPEPQPVVRQAEPEPQPAPSPDLVAPAPQPRVIEQTPVQPRPAVEPQPVPLLRQPEAPTVEPVARAELAPTIRREVPQVRPIITKRPQLAPAQPTVPLIERAPVTDVEVPVQQTPDIFRQARKITRATPPVQASPVRPTQAAPPPLATPIPPTSPTTALKDPAPVAPVVKAPPSRPVQAAGPQAVVPVQPTAPTVAPAPAPVVAAPVVAAPVTPAPGLEAVAPSVLEAYRQSISREIMRHLLYPRIAVMRKWQGKTVVEMQLAADGSVTQMIIVQSSGKEVLDEAALKMVKKSLPLPKPPRGVRAVKVPVVFRLQG